MNTPYRLIAIDIDGTLMNSRNELPSANADALCRAHKAGLRICLCTGRCLTETRDVLERLSLDLDAGVFVFGAVVSDLQTGRTLHRSSLELDLAGRIVSFFAERQLPVLALYDACEAGYDYLVFRGPRHADACQGWIDASPCLIREAPGRSTLATPPLRVSAIVDPADAGDTVADLADAFPDGCLKSNLIFAPNYGVHVLECFSPQVNKWYGLNHLLDQWDIQAREVVAIGDDVNDVEMISRAGLGMAMGNACSEVKAVARREAPDNNACGVAATIDAVLNGDLNRLAS